MDYVEASSMLDKYGIRSIESRYVSSAEQAVKFAGSSPIVMKVLSGKALHKSRSGLVKLDLRGKEEIGRAFAELEKKAKSLSPYKIIAQKMAGKGIEVIIGGKTDEQFGKTILLGLGGIYVEVFKDFSLRICPIRQIDAKEMISQLKSGDVITYNGKNAKMLEELLMKVSKLLSANDRIAELDLNPVILREDGYDVVDIRILK
ncbi:MAG: acetate--CoA ligase family protein [Candidatus Micrarchaeota archaeon]|nr:acetate--CoA ligase family protein [Candidatus Micrarchaeota archaeon]